MVHIWSKYMFNPKVIFTGISYDDVPSPAYKYKCNKIKINYYEKIEIINIYYLFNILIILIIQGVFLPVHFMIFTGNIHLILINNKIVLLVKRWQTA